MGAFNIIGPKGFSHLNQFGMYFGNTCKMSMESKIFAGFAKTTTTTKTEEKRREEKKIFVQNS